MILRALLPLLLLVAPAASAAPRDEANALFCTPPAHVCVHEVVVGDPSCETAAGHARYTAVRATPDGAGETILIGASQCFTADGGRHDLHWVAVTHASPTGARAAAAWGSGERPSGHESAVFAYVVHDGRTVRAWWSNHVVHAHMIGLEWGTGSPAGPPEAPELAWGELLGWRASPRARARALPHGEAARAARAREHANGPRDALQALPRAARAMVENRMRAFTVGRTEPREAPRRLGPGARPTRGPRRLAPSARRAREGGSGPRGARPGDGTGQARPRAPPMP